MTDERYQAFLERVREIHRAGAIEELLGWDQETYMPKKAAAHRGQLIGMVAAFAHERLISDEFGSLLERMEKDGVAERDVAAAANVREMRRRYDRAVKLPTRLVRDIAEATAVAKPAWAEARAAKDFARFAPHLGRVLELKREVARLIGWSAEPYDALLDEFEPGARSAEIATVFDGLKAELVPLVAAIRDARRQPDESLLARPCPVADQAAFGRRVVESLGFDFDAGRIDVSTHPFCSSTSPHDVRLTTRYREDYFPQALFGTMHEAGHGLYEQGLDPAHVDTPMGRAVSLGIHESQSRLWENFVGRSRAFWEHWFPRFQQAFPAYRDVALDDFHFAINRVRPSFIRVEADEVTYNLHIMLRFDLERRLVAGSLSVADVPEAWNDAVGSFLGIRPPDDAQGCLQDIHWSSGIFGYFPTYALGNLYAAQFCESARAALGDLDERLRRGETRGLLEWLREKIHRHGMRWRAADLVRVVTGRGLSHGPFMQYLRGKFGALYGV